MTRIVAGRLGGRRITAPPGRYTRPTSDRVREALFATLSARLDLPGCRFLDLFAGSGAVGLEAASRGAGAVLLIESDPVAARAARANIAALGLERVCHLATGRVLAVLSAGAGKPYDVAFADPPYRMADEEVTGTLTALVTGGWLVTGGVVVIERSARSPEPVWPAGLLGERSRRYGETLLWYGRRA